MTNAQHIAQRANPGFVVWLCRTAPAVRRIAFSEHPDNLPWDAVGRILDVATFERSTSDLAGSVTLWFRLRKQVGRYPAGKVLPLRKLHAILFSISK